MLTDLTSATCALELRDITKRFGDLVANDRINLRVKPSEIHAVVGENGAGKTTLMNICFGILQPDSGAILVNGSEVRIASPNDARTLGIGMVHQHFMLVDGFTVAENVFLGAEKTHGLATVDRARMVADLRKVSHEYGLDVDPTAPVSALSAGQKQRVEILKALYFDAKILILDEPTAVLTPQESDRLFDVLRSLAERGRSVILITHKLREVLAVAHTYTVIRAGSNVSSAPTEGATESGIATLMVGRDVTFGRVEPIPDERPIAAPSMVVAHLTVVSDDGPTEVDDVSLDLRPGEITGIAGVEGNGQTELFRALAGLIEPAAGWIELDGADVTRTNIATRRAAGLAYVSEDRLEDGVAGKASVTDNLLPGFLRSDLFHWGVTRTAAVRSWAARLVRKYDVRGAGPATPVGELSGGNIQKVVVARELETMPRVLLAAQPTRGVDVGAMEFIHARLRDARDGGAAVLVASADLSELLALSDRILVMYRGAIVAEFAPDQALIPRIGLAMAGAVDPEDAIGQGALLPSPAAPHAAQKSSRTAVTIVDRTSPDDDAAPLLERTRDHVVNLAYGLVQPAAAVIISLILGAAFIIMAGSSPLHAYTQLLFGSFTSGLSFSGMIAQSTPLLLIATSAYMSFRAEIFNIGGEGQMYAGAFIGGIAGAYFGWLPGGVLIVVCLILGAIAGAFIAWIPGVLDAYMGVDVLVTTLMINYVVQNLTAYFSSGPLRDPNYGQAATAQIAPQAHLPTILGNGGANIGALIGVAILVVLGFAIVRTRWGLTVRLVGDNREFARTIGINVKQRIVQVMIVSGLVAGAAGVIASLGTQFRFTQAFSPGYGFIGITVALLGKLNPIGIGVAALFYGSLVEGASVMQVNTSVPLSLVNVLEGAIIVLMTAAALQITRRRRAKDAPLRGATATASPALTAMKVGE